MKKKKVVAALNDLAQEILESNASQKDKFAAVFVLRMVMSRLDIMVDCDKYREEHGICLWRG